MNVVIAGFSPNDRVPGAYGEVLYGQGAISVGSIPLLLLLVGQMTDDGTARTNRDVKTVFSAQQARQYFGGGSQLARMCLAALSVSGVNIRAIAVAQPDGAVPAAAKITIGGTWDTNWNFEYRVGGETYAGIISSTDTPATAAARIASVFNSEADCPVIAAPANGVVTLTCKCKGAIGNRFILMDASVLAPGATSVVAGGVAASGGGVFFGGGVGAEDVTQVLSTIEPMAFDRIAIGQGDATNLRRWRAQINSQADVLVGILQHAVCATNDTFATAVSLAQTTLNAERFQVCWQYLGETHPSELAANMAALRTQKEQVDPAAAYDGAILAGVAPHSQPGDIPSHMTQVAALNSGVTPISTTGDGYAVVVRAITSHSLRGSIPDYSILDTSDAVVPDYVLKDLKLTWVTKVAPANPRIGPDPAPNERNPPSGVLTPNVWNSIVYGRLKGFEAGKDLPAPILMRVDDNLPVSSFDAQALRIMTSLRMISAANNHQIGISVRPSSLAAA
ncbi:hypothetical protein LZC95_19880 [Pendulispora brunnea]|uniref:Uncharacterized protein n=1 Tax=Pendulispora brunnea TaxID=2905690 RepID=A0ABZ2KPY0_9BACT